MIGPLTQHGEASHEPAAKAGSRAVFAICAVKSIRPYPFGAKNCITAIGACQLIWAASRRTEVLMKMLQSTVSLRSKIILLVSATAFCTAFIIGGLNYYGISQIAVDKSIEKLAGETRLAALNVKSAYAEMRNDAFVLSRTPPILGMIYAMQNGGVDPWDGFTRAHWHERLNTIFASIIKARPHYRQVRLIGLADNGRELVSVVRNLDGEIGPITPKNMQDKGGEPYFQPGSMLQPDHYFYSNVTYKLEYGKNESTLIPTIRMVIPIFDDQGHRFGILVINADYELFLSETLRNSDVRDVIYISDNYGNYIKKYKDNKISKLQLIEDKSFAILQALEGKYFAMPAFIQKYLQGEIDEGRFSADENIGYYYRLKIAPLQSEASISTFILVPKSELLAGANALINENLLSGALLVLAASLAAAALGHRLTRPIARMTAQITALGRDGGIEALDLPVHRRDEVGELARAFHELTAWLVLSDEHSKKLSTQLDAFIANAVDGFIIINDRGIIEKVNPTLLDLFGYESDELLGSNVAMLMPEAVRVKYDGFLQAYRTTGVLTVTGTIRDEIARRKDGSVFPIALAVSQLRFADRSVFTGIIRDMTAVRHAQHKIELYAAELERSNQELDQFAYVASHDLKAPLRVINNASRWLEEDLDGKLTEDDRENMTLLRNRVQRMEKLLDDLLDYSRIGKADDDRYSEIIDGDTMMDNVLLLLPAPPGMKVRVAAAFKTISVHRMPLQQVLFNLVNNAIKHHDRDSGLIEIGVVPSEDYLCFTVRDDGPGIPKEFQEKIFEMFHTLRPRDQVEGSGMGLALAKKTVERLGGVITVTSDGSRGAEFAFTWPAKRQSSNFSEKAA